ncbi:MAG: flagellar biosynthetic protein FliO [Xanthomonadaceae bacterium]|nr:flagellar biosynthetic protein FliO [Xanthomonadaceae bacterium]
MRIARPAKFVTAVLLAGLAPWLRAAEEALPRTQAAGADPLAVGNLVQLTLGLLAVLLLLGGLAWLLRRSGRFTTGMHGALQVLGGVSMGTRERVVLLQVGKQQLLVGVAPGRIQTLHVLDEPIDVTESPMRPKAGFAQALDMALGRSKPQ